MAENRGSPFQSVYDEINQLHLRYGNLVQTRAWVAKSYEPNLIQCNVIVKDKALEDRDSPYAMLYLSGLFHMQKWTKASLLAMIDSELAELNDTAKELKQKLKG